MSTDFVDYIEQAKVKNNIVDIIGRDIKLERYGNLHKACCPFHDEKTPSFTVYQDTQSYFCFGAGCGARGDVIDWIENYHHKSKVEALEILGITVSDNGHKPKPKRKAYSSMEEYAKTRGLPGAMHFKEYGCYEGKFGGGPAIFIPTRDGIDRVRRLHPDGAKYQPVKGGVEAQLWGLEKAIETATSEKLPKLLVFCNGQVSSMVATFWGIPAFCQTDGEKEIREKLLPELFDLARDGWQFVIALDSDDKGQGMKVAHAIYRQFASAGFYNTRVIDFDKGGGYDLADFCREHGDKSYEKLSEYYTTPKFASDYTLQSLAMATKELSTNIKATEAKTKISEVNTDIIDKLKRELSIIENVINPTSTNNNTSFLDALAASRERYHEGLKSPEWVKGLKSGLDKFDILTGGFLPGTVTTFLGETGSGKTQLMASMLCSLLRKYIGIGYFGESAAIEIIDRMVSYLTGYIPYTSIMRGGMKDFATDEFIPYTDKQKAELNKAYEIAHPLAARFHKAPNGNMPRLDDLYDTAMRQIEYTGAKFLVVDSLNNFIGNGTEYEIVTRASVVCEDIAVRSGVVVINTVQGGRNTKDRSKKVLQLRDNRGSGAVEEKASTHVTLYNHTLLVSRGEAEANPDFTENDVRLKINKMRFGATGNTAKAWYVPGVGFYNVPKIDSKQVVDKTAQPALPGIPETKTKNYYS